MNNFEKEKELNLILLKLYELNNINKNNNNFNNIIEILNLIIKLNNPYIIDNNNNNNNNNFLVIDNIFFKKNNSNNLYIGNSIPNNLNNLIGIYKITKFGFKFIKNIKNFKIY
jgi:hypothetical protein